MRTLLLILCLIVTNEIWGQTFKVTDIKITGSIDEREKQEKKLQGLDAKVKLTFYDNSVKCTFCGSKENGLDTEEYVLEKTDKPNEYRSVIMNTSYRKCTITLKLKTLMNYITSATIEMEDKKGYDHSSRREVTFVITLKRD